MPARKQEFWALFLIAWAIDPMNGKAQNSYAPFLLGHTVIWGLMETLQQFAPLKRPVVASITCTNLPQAYVARISNSSWK